MIRKLLIANRGEIACRIARTARRMGISVVAVYSDADAQARHVRIADEAWRIGGAPAQESYLQINAVLEAARRSGADAIHPGYGFLAENAEFAARCAEAKIAFVGPPASAIQAMGSKSEAKARMQRAGVPVLPGYHGDEQDLAFLTHHAERIGFPLLIKPSAGGGGKGMHIVRERGELEETLNAARRIARSAFGDDRLLLERYLPAPRHVEVQVFADKHGNVVHLFDRDCSVQRRHQKLIEEAPAPQVDPDVRARMHAAALTVAKEIGYEGAGTVEFLLDGREFYFLEMNTRLQVEHPVTEAITGLDLVEWQLRVASGEPLPLAQSAIVARGHAIEARVCAEDPEKDFLPASGVLQFVHWPVSADGVRVDHGFESGDSVPSHYDSLLGKIIAAGSTRSEALARLGRALREVRIAGVATNVGFLARALADEDFANAKLSTRFLEDHPGVLRATGSEADLAPFAAAAVMASRKPKRGVANPWEYLDGFRIAAPAAGMRVALRGASGAFKATVHPLRDDAFDVDLGHKTVSITLTDTSGPLWRFHSQDGGPHADVLLNFGSINVWREHEHAVLELETEHVPRNSAAGVTQGSLSTPLPGVIVSVAVSEGEHVRAGQALLVVEAMKMEHVIRAPREGIVTGLKHSAGDRVAEGVTLLEIRPLPDTGE